MLAAGLVVLALFGLVLIVLRGASDTPDVTIGRGSAGQADGLAWSRTSLGVAAYAALFAREIGNALVSCAGSSL